MEELLYSARDIAEIINKYDVKLSQSIEMLNAFWNNGLITYLQPEYRDNKMHFVKEVSYWCGYFSMPDKFSDEAPLLQKDFLACGIDAQTENLLNNEYENLEPFFKELYLRLRFIEKKGYVVLKLRTLLHQYGYQRRTQGLVAYFKECLYFYHIYTYLRAGEKCDIARINIDDMITFRAI